MRADRVQTRGAPATLRAPSYRRRRERLLRINAENEALTPAGGETVAEQETPQDWCEPDAPLLPVLGRDRPAGTRPDPRRMHLPACGPASSTANSHARAATASPKGSYFAGFGVEICGRGGEIVGRVVVLLRDEIGDSLVSLGRLRTSLSRNDLVPGDTRMVARESRPVGRRLPGRKTRGEANFPSGSPNCLANYAPSWLRPPERDGGQRCEVHRVPIRVHTLGFPGSGRRLSKKKPVACVGGKSGIRCVVKRLRSDVEPVVPATRILRRRWVRRAVWVRRNRQLYRPVGPHIVQRVPRTRPTGFEPVTFGFVDLRRAF